MNERRQACDTMKFKAGPALFSVACASVLSCALHVSHHKLPAMLHPLLAAHVYVSDGFTLQEKNCIYNGVKMWSDATNGAIAWQLSSVDVALLSGDLQVTTPGSNEVFVVFRRVTSDSEMVRKWDAKHLQSGPHHEAVWLMGLLVGDTRTEMTRAYLVEDRLMNVRTNTVIAAHEFGHAMGLEHVNDVNAVMNAMNDPIVAELNDSDIDEFCAKRHCDAIR